MDSGRSSSSENMEIEDMEVINFLLRSKLAGHEAAFEEQKQALDNEKSEKRVLQQTMNDLISIAAESETSFTTSSDIINLQNELDEKNKVVTNLECELNGLKQKVVDQEDMEVMNFLLHSKLNSHELAFEEQNQALAQEKSEKIVLQQTMKAFEEQNQALAQERSEKIVLQKTMNDLISIAASESDSAQEILNLQKELSEKNVDVADLKRQLDGLREKVSDQDLHKELVDELNVEIFLLRSKLSSHEVYLDEMKVKTQLQQEKMKNDSLSMLEQEKSLSNQKNEQKNNQIASLQCSLDSSISKAKSLQAELLQVQKTFSGLESKHLKALKSKEERIDEYGVEVFLLNSKLSSYESSHKEMQAAISLENMKARCLIEQNANLLRLVEQEKNKNKETNSNMQLDLKNNVVSELEINIARLNEDLQNTFATIDKLEAEKSDAEETIHNLRNTMDTSNILKEKESNLENKLLLSNQEIDDLKNQKEKYETHLEELELKLGTTSKEVDELKEQLEATKKCNENSEESYVALIKEHQTLTEEKAILEMDFVAIQDKNQSIVEGMRESSEKLEAKILLRNQQIEVLQTDKGESEMRHFQILEKLKMAEKSVDDLKKQSCIELNDLRRRQRQLMSETSETLALKQESIEDLKVEVFLLSSKLSSYEKSYEDLTRNLEELNKAMQISEKTVIILKGQLADDDKTMSDLSATNAQLNNQIDLLAEEKNVALEQLRKKVSELDTAKENLQSIENRAILSEETIASMNREKGCNDELKSYYENQIKEIQQRIDDQEITRENLQQNLQENSALYQTQIQELNRKLEEAENNCVDATMQLLSSTVQLQESEAESMALSQKNIDMQNALKSMEVEKQKLESEKQTFLLQQEEMENHQKTEKNRQIADLEDQVLNLSSGLLTRNEEISQLREEIESQKRDLLTLEGCISTLTESKKLEEESSSNLKKEVDASHESLRQKDQHIANLEEKIAQIDESLESQILDTLAKEEEVESMTSELKESKDVAERLQSQNDMLKNRISEIETVEGNLVQSLDEIKQSMNEKQEKIECLTKEKSESLEILQTTSSKLNETEVNLKEATTKLTTVERHCDDLKELLETKEGEYVQSLDELENNLLQKSQQCDENVTTIKNLQQSIDTLKTDLDLKSTESSKSEIKIHQLEDGLQTLETDKGNLIQSLEEVKQSMHAKQEKIECLIREKSESSEILQTTRAKLNETEVELKEAISKITDMEKQSDDLKELLEAKEGEFVQSLDELENDLSEKSKQCDENNATIKNLEQSINALKNDMELKSTQCIKDETKIHQLEDEIRILKTDASKLQETMETSKEENRKQLDAKESEAKKLKNELEAITKEKDSKMAKIKLLLGNQKKLESQLKKDAGDFEEMVTINEELKKRLLDRDALEVEVQNLEKQIEELKSQDVESGGSGAPMPWEVDPELQDMTPTELKSILGNDLEPREKARLNEMCVQELEKELKAKISAETSHIWQISSLTKELEKNKIKLNHLQKTGNGTTTQEAAEKPNVATTIETKQTRGIKRRSLPKENDGCQIVSTTPARGARTGVKKDIVAVDHEAPAVSTSAKKPRRSARDSTAVSTAASDNMKKAGGGGQEENDIKLTMTSTRSKKISTRGGGSGGRNQMLDKGMMDNPFAKKTTRSSTSNKIPLETITNRS